MFGSSEDRARLLAGRSRRQRISSAASGSSSGSKPELSLPADEQVSHENIRPYTNDQVSGQKGFDHASESSIVSSVSPVPAESRNFQLEQQRLQSEHLSQVLYNSIDLPKLAELSRDDLELAPHVHLEGLATSSATCSSARTIAALDKSAPLSNSPPLNLLKLFSTSTSASPLGTAASEIYLRLQPVVSLRGGSGGEDPYDREAEYALREHVLRVQNPQDFKTYVSSWHQEVSNYHNMLLVSMARKVPSSGWIEPITAGLSYEGFLSSLAITQIQHFEKLFGPAPGSNFPGAPRARAAFLHSLGEKLRTKFLDALKGSLFMKMIRSLCVSSGGIYPPAMLSLLLSTAEEFVSLIPAHY